MGVVLALSGCSRSEVRTDFDLDGGAALAVLEGAAPSDDEVSADDSTADDSPADDARDDSPADDSAGDDGSNDDSSPDDAVVDDSPAADDMAATDDSSNTDDAVNPDDAVEQPDCSPGSSRSCSDEDAGSVRCVGRIVVTCEFVDGCLIERRENNPEFCLDEDAERECSDGLDDDGDGAVDCADSDCVGAGPCTVEICDNGFDDDEDGATDCADSQCSLVPACNDDCVDENDDGQFDCAECGGGPECLLCPYPDADLGSTLGFAIVSGNTSGADNDAQGSCGRGSSSPDVVFTWSPPVTGCYDIDTFGSDYDTTLHLHQPCPSFQEIRCDDDSGNDAQSKITLDLPAGEPLAIVVDGYGDGSSGEFVLSINACAEDCADFDDNDLDGLWDCEDPDCEGHTQCVPEVCGNGIDDDDDNLVDCEDEECQILGQCVECLASVDESLGSSTGAVATGSTIGAGRDVNAECGAGAGSEDVVLSWTAAAAGCYSFDTFGSDYDTVLHARSQCPESEPLACNDDTLESTESQISLDVAAGETVLLVIDGYGDTSSGEYALNIRECLEDCSNGEDDDLDGAVDCRDDECRMAEPCVPEVCDDGNDNDGDGDTDCEDDECAALDECFSCPVADFDLGSETGTAIADGTTVGAGASFTASCGGGSLSQDVLFSWVAPFDGCFMATTDGSNFDTTLHVHGRCPGFEELECDDDSGQLERSLLEFDAEGGEPYYFVVDGYARNSTGDFVLSIFECP